MFKSFNKSDAEGRKSRKAAVAHIIQGGGILGPFQGLDRDTCFLCSVVPFLTWPITLSEWPCLMSMLHEIVYVTQENTMASSPRSGLFFFFSWLREPEPHSPTGKKFSSVSQSCPILCDPMDCSTPGFPVHHQLWNYSNSYPSSQWCHPTISFSVIPMSSCLQSFPASGFFPMSLIFTSGGQSIGVQVSASVLPMSTQDWFPLGWTGWISL